MNRMGGEEQLRGHTKSVYARIRRGKIPKSGVIVAARQCENVHIRGFIQCRTRFLYVKMLRPVIAHTVAYRHVT